MLASDPIEQRAVRSGEDVVERRAEHRDRATARIHRGPVGDRVDTFGKPADHHDVAAHECSAERLGTSDAVVGHLPRADHTDALAGV